MGNTAATPAAHGGEEDLDPFDGIETLGYRVLGVQPNSPASQAGLVSFFDFLVGANGRRLLGSGEGLEDGEEYDDIDFPALLHEHKGRPVELLVWNIKAQDQRFVDLTPDDTWGGAGLLGVTIKLDDYGGADERLIRVLSVEPNSPASTAGLVPLEDFLLGTTATAFGSTEVLASVLNQHLDQVLEVYVYNSSSDMVRVVAIMPTLSWGGQGMLGAEVGTGFLHRLPSSSRSTPGQSVERKIRWLKDNENGQEGGQTQSLNDLTANAGDGGGRLATATAPTEQQSMLTMEPHLEMERSSSGDAPEATTRQPHELGNMSSENSTGAKIHDNGNGNAPTAVTKQAPALVPVPMAEPTAHDALAPLVPPPSYSSPYSPSVAKTLPPSSPEEASALFSAPPPDQVAPQMPVNPFSAMPTPPKMSALDGAAKN